MDHLNDRASYLRGLADGMGLDKSKNENRLMLELLDLVAEMSHRVAELSEDLEDLEGYVDDIDEDLADMEDMLFGEEDDDDDDDDDCDCCDDDCDCCGGCGDDEELSFQCPHCGEDVTLSAADIGYDQSPVCKSCGKPFFPPIDESDE